MIWGPEFLPYGPLSSTWSRVGDLYRSLKGSFRGLGHWARAQPPATWTAKDTEKCGLAIHGGSRVKGVSAPQWLILAQAFL